jgi:hypothetical protein
MHRGAMRAQNKRVSKGIGLGPPANKPKHDPTQNFARLKQKKELDKKNREEALKHYEERVRSREESIR